MPGAPSNPAVSDWRRAARAGSLGHMVHELSLGHVAYDLIHVGVGSLDLGSRAEAG
jgi:hypothetical protein